MAVEKIFESYQAENLPGGATANSKVIPIEPFLKPPQLATILRHPRLDAHQAEEIRSLDHEFADERSWFEIIRQSQLAYQILAARSETLTDAEKASFKSLQSNILFSHSQLSPTDELSTAPNEHLWKVVRSSTAAMENVVEKYTPLVKRIVAKTHRSQYYFEEEDDYQNGSIGLLKAIAGYDLNRGVRFSTYATLRIQGAVHDGQRTYGKLARSHTRDGELFQQVFDELTQDFGRTPEIWEIAYRLDSPYRRVYKLASATLPFEASISNPISESDDDRQVQYEDILADSTDITQDVVRGEAIPYVRQAVSQLSSREQLIFKLHYDQGLTFRLVANELGISESRAVQLHARLLRSVQESLIKLRYVDPGEIEREQEVSKRRLAMVTSFNDEETQSEPLNYDLAKMIVDSPQLWGSLSYQEKSYLSQIAFGFNQTNVLRRLSHIYELSPETINREIELLLAKFQ